MSVNTTLIINNVLYFQQRVNVLKFQIDILPYGVLVSVTDENFNRSDSQIILFKNSVASRDEIKKLIDKVYC